MLLDELRGGEPVVTMAFVVHRCPRFLTAVVRGTQQLIHGIRTLNYQWRQAGSQVGVCGVAINEGGEALDDVAGTLVSEPPVILLSMIFDVRTAGCSR
ncbi:MAG: hypothetical protein ACTHU1_12695 [Arachnia sp.]